MSELVYFTDIHGHRWPCTPVQKLWLTEFQAEAIRRTKAGLKGYIRYGLDIFQVVGGAPRSGGTHLVDPDSDEACCIDFANTSFEMIRLARDMGADATWKRPYNWDGRKGMAHGHINLRGLANRYANYQYNSRKSGVDYGKNGLANGGKDTGPKPLSKRTYKEGIDWAKRQGLPVPPPSPEPIPDTHLSFGYGNLFLPYVLDDKARARIRAQLGLIKVMKVSLFVALELHEENGDKGALHYFALEAAKQGLAVARGKGGNHLLYDPKKYLVLRSENKDMGGRWASKWNLQRIDTGGKFWVVGFHATAGKTKGLVRSKQFKNLVSWTSTLQRVIFAVDKNNYTDSPGSPTRLLRQAGLTDLYDQIEVENEQYNSHHGGAEKGIHIDAVLSGKLAYFRNGKQWRTAALADHDWIQADITIKGVAA